MTSDILIVNDERNLRLSTAQIMREAGYSVATAVNESEALGLLQNRHFDLVFLDIRLLARGEATIIPKIQSLCPWIRLLVFSPYLGPDLPLWAFEGQKIRYLAKPIEPVEILSATRCLLSGES